MLNSSVQRHYKETRFIVMLSVLRSIVSHNNNTVLSALSYAENLGIGSLTHVAVIVVNR